MAKNNSGVTGVPFYGHKIKLNHVYPEKTIQASPIKWRQLWAIIPLLFRYFFYFMRIIFDKRQPPMNFFKVQNTKQIYGVPIGGIGSGTIGRGYRGEFCRFQMKPGMYEYNTVHADQFIVTIKDANHQTIFQSVLSTYEKPVKNLTSWEWLIDGAKCKFTGLYPRSWTEYDLSEFGVTLTCRQISPVIPNNYKDSSLPCAVFVWSIENVCSEVRNVTISFTFKNGTSMEDEKRKSPCSSELFTNGSTEGVLLHHLVKDMPCTYVLSAQSKPDVSISKMLNFDPLSDGSLLWSNLEEKGCFSKPTATKTSECFQELGCAIAVQTSVQPKSSADLVFGLAWHMPEIKFIKSDKIYTRYYTKHFDANNKTAQNIADYALKNYSLWEQEISLWQSQVLNDPELPDWYKGALFNELYYISDGGTLWLLMDKNELIGLPPSDPRTIYGRFAYLEAHEYRMYNTYDVHFYAAYALVLNWPHLQLCLQYDFKDTVFKDIPTPRKQLFDGKICQRKVANTIPHDLGDPDEAPFTLINCYPIHNVSDWRDLNVKYVISVFRDYSLGIGGLNYIRDLYNSCKAVIEFTSKWDKDEDGLIENSGTPDQTYDIWSMIGPSAYCGGLWLGALYAMERMSAELGFEADRKRYSDMLRKGIESYENKLWNGRYYKFDASNRPESDSIMADQLCAHWFIRSSGYKYEVFAKDKVLAALKTIYENNVMKFGNGLLGAVNGYMPSGRIDDVAVQSMEVWTGVTYGLAATMIYEGMTAEAWKTAGGMHNTLAYQIGMIYEMPEAFYHNKNYRAIGYMRPLSIWGMQLAWRNRQK